MICILKSAVKLTGNLILHMKKKKRYIHIYAAEVFFNIHELYIQGTPRQFFYENHILRPFSSLPFLFEFAYSCFCAVSGQKGCCRSFITKLKINFNCIKKGKKNL